MKTTDYLEVRRTESEKPEETAALDNESMKEGA